MQTVELANPDAGQRQRYFRRLSDALGTDCVAVNYFERAPGESVGDFYHRHHEQEELFVVLAGAATFETEDGTVRVESGEMVRFAPGEWQQGWNRETERLRVLALGVPLEEGPTDLRGNCPACDGRRPVTVEETDAGVDISCSVCGTAVPPGR